MKKNENFRDKVIGLQGNLLSFAYQLTSNREEAEDLLQDTTLKALDNQDKYVDNVNFKGWIFTIMRNIFINNYRQTVRKATVIDQTEDLYHLNVCQDSGFTTPEGSYAVKEISSVINSFEDDLRQPFNSRLQIQRDIRETWPSPRHSEKPHLHGPQVPPRTAGRLQIRTASPNEVKALGYKRSRIHEVRLLLRLVGLMSFCLYLRRAFGLRRAIVMAFGLTMVHDGSTLAVCISAQGRTTLGRTVHITLLKKLYVLFGSEYILDFAEIVAHLYVSLGGIQLADLCFLVVGKVEGAEHA